MNHPMEQPVRELPDTSERDGEIAEAIDTDLTHPVLSRLLEEVRNEKRVDAAYDRVHHRHNRGR